MAGVKRTRIKPGVGPKRKTGLRSIPKRSHWKLALDKLCRKIVIKRDKVCLRCGKWVESGRGFGMQAAHIYGKGSHPRMRFDTRNIILLCQPCHYWWHAKGFGREAAPTNEVREWCLARLGKKRMQALDLQSKVKIAHKTDPELTRIALELEAKLAGVEP